MFSKRNLGALLLVALWSLVLPAEELSNETLAGIKPGDDWARVKAQYGGPDSQTSGGYTEEFGCHDWNYKYEAKGLEFSVCHENKNKAGAAAVTYIRAFGKSEAKTGKGTGLGASREEIEKAYGKSETQGGNELYYYHFESGVQIGFILERGKVTEINLTMTS